MRRPTSTSIGGTPRIGGKVFYTGFDIALEGKVPFKSLYALKEAISGVLAAEAKLCIAGKRPNIQIQPSPTRQKLYR